MLAFVTGPGAAVYALIHSHDIFHVLSFIMTGMTVMDVLPRLWPIFLGAVQGFFRIPHIWFRIYLGSVYGIVGVLALCGVGWFPQLYTLLADACRQIFIALQHHGDHSREKLKKVAKPTTIYYQDPGVYACEPGVGTNLEKRPLKRMSRSFS